jgi:hypothetical protein
MRLFQVDDGCIYYLMAEDHTRARKRWMAQLLDQGEAEATMMEDRGEPVIIPVDPTKAASISVRIDDTQITCPRCAGLGTLPGDRSLLDLFHEEMRLPEARRARNGILSCSEW